MEWDDQSAYVDLYLTISKQVVNQSFLFLEFNLWIEKTDNSLLIATWTFLINQYQLIEAYDRQSYTSTWLAADTRLPLPHQ